MTGSPAPHRSPGTGGTSSPLLHPRPPSAARCHPAQPRPLPPLPSSTPALSATPYQPTAEPPARQCPALTRPALAARPAEPISCPSSLPASAGSASRSTGPLLSTPYPDPAPPAPSTKPKTPQH